MGGGGNLTGAYVEDKKRRMEFSMRRCVSGKILFLQVDRDRLVYRIAVHGAGEGHGKAARDDSQ